MGWGREWAEGAVGGWVEERESGQAPHRAREDARTRGGWRASLPAHALLPPCPPHACVRCGQGCGVGVCAASRTKQGQEQGEGEGGAGHFCWVSEEVRGGRGKGEGGGGRKARMERGGPATRALFTHTVLPSSPRATPPHPRQEQKKKRKRTHTHTHTHTRTTRLPPLEKRERGARADRPPFSGLGSFSFFFFGYGFGPATPAPPPFFLYLLCSRARTSPSIKKKAQSHSYAHKHTHTQFISPAQERAGPHPSLTRP